MPGGDEVMFDRAHQLPRHSVAGLTGPLFHCHHPGGFS